MSHGEHMMDRFADAITPDELGTYDYLEVIEALEPIMRAGALSNNYLYLCNRLEVCPIHHCDERICQDDGVHEPITTLHQYMEMRYGNH